MSLTDRSISRSVAGGNSVDFSEKRNGYGGSLYHRGHSDRVVERTLAKYKGGGAATNDPTSESFSFNEGPEYTGSYSDRSPIKRYDLDSLGNMTIYVKNRNYPNGHLIKVPKNTSQYNKGLIKIKQEYPNEYENLIKAGISENPYTNNQVTYAPTKEIGESTNDPMGMGVDIPLDNEPDFAAEQLFPEGYVSEPDEEPTNIDSSLQATSPPVRQLAKQPFQAQAYSPPIESPQELSEVDSPSRDSSLVARKPELSNLTEEPSSEEANVNPARLMDPNDRSWGTMYDQITGTIGDAGRGLANVFSGYDSEGAKIVDLGNLYKDFAKKNNLSDEDLKDMMENPEKAEEIIASKTIEDEEPLKVQKPKASGKGKDVEWEYDRDKTGRPRTRKKGNKKWITPADGSAMQQTLEKELGRPAIDSLTSTSRGLGVGAPKYPNKLEGVDVSANPNVGASSGSDELVKQKNTYKGLGNTLSDLGTAGVGLANYFSGKRALDDLDNIGHSPELNLNQAVNVEELSNEGNIQGMKAEGNRLVRAGLMSGNLNKESLSALAMSETQKNISRSNANMNNVNIGIRNQNRMNSQQVMGENLNAINNRDRENYNNDASRKIAQIQGRQQLSGQLTNHLTQTLAQANQRKLDNERMEIERSFDPYGTRQRREEEKQKKRDSQTWLQRNLWS